MGKSFLEYKINHSKSEESIDSDVPTIKTTKKPAPKKTAAAAKKKKKVESSEDDDFKGDDSGKDCLISKLLSFIR